ncbi:carbohydrate ABC transporter permease [Candidatus Aerophobetes bacterium]|nr:carbohydrate ABC transporter permease [Candidatus Aerophobetes bacterium]
MFFPKFKKEELIDSTKLKKAILYLIWLICCLAITAFIIGPFLWMLLSSFKTPTELLRFPPTWIPKGWTLENFGYAWRVLNWPRMFLNTAFLVGTITILTLFFNSLAGFAFAKMHFPGRRTLFFLVIAALLIPVQIPLIPRFLMMAKIGLVGTFVPLILFAVCQAFHTFLFRQFFMGIPDEIIESAKIDGASYFRCYWSLVVPLSKPVFAALAIITFIWHWNAYLYPMIYLLDPKMHTVQIGLALFQSEYGIKFGPLMAAATFVAVPTTIVYLVLQRHFRYGITLTGVKG